MCGLTGFIDSGKLFSEKQLSRMTDIICHRGPDANGIYSDGQAYLGHVRLSVLDTSSNANQPFFSKCKRYVIVYNGEVYNFKELAAKYKIATVTNSDTEVILELFVQFGSSFVNEINGMFSIVIYDIPEKEIFIFRDRIGIKPLFYYFDKGVLAFSSELKSLKYLLGPVLSIDYTSVSNFLYVGYIPEPRTIYREIKKFPSGSLATFKNGYFKIQKYWISSKKIKSKTICDKKQAKQTLKELLESSVQYCMVSDVPFGTFLSGGTDSSLISAIAQKYSSKPLKTFSIGFKENSFNEAQHAREVSEYLKTDHHEFILSEKNAIEQVDKLLNIYDEPFADSSAIPTLLVSEMAKNEVSVTLSGDGGDELFMGYGMYNWAFRLSNPFIKPCRSLIYFILSKGDNRQKRAGNVFNYKTEGKIKSHIFSQEQYYFSEDEIGCLLKNDAPVEIEENYIDLSRKLSPREGQSFYDLNNYLKDDLLVKVDRASMYHSLETRVPLLDYRLVEFALNLDESLKVNQGIEKYLLKEVLYDYIPKKVMERPKWGFSIPLEKWLSKDLKYLIDKYLSKEAIESTGLFNYFFVASLLGKYFAGQSYLYNRIWQLIVLQKWLQESV